MSLHESVIVEMQRYVDDKGDCQGIGATALATAAYLKFKGKKKVETHIEYGCIEGFKTLARRVLRGRYDPISDESIEEQGEFFSGHLQERYPTPAKGDEEPMYKRRDDLTKVEADWNERRMSRHITGLTAHRDAFKAWARTHFAGEPTPQDASQAEAA